MTPFKVWLSAFAIMSLGLGFAQTFPVALEHKYGSTTIEEQPEHIVTLGYNDQDALYAVGIDPVAVRFWFGDDPHAIFPWAETAAAGATPEVLNMTELDFEAILGLNPDLIIAAYSGITQPEYDQLSEIAPTVAQSGDYNDYGTPWQEMTQTIGKAVGKVAPAEAAVQKVEKAFGDVRAAHPEFEGKSVAVALFNDATTYYVYQSQENRSRFFTNLGFQVPQTIDALAGDEFSFALSEERYDLLDQDVLVVISVADTPDSLRQKLSNNPLLRQLSVVAENRTVYVTGANAQALGFNTVLSLPFALEGVLPDLSAAAAQPE